jgi:hypothetical protein
VPLTSGETVTSLPCDRDGEVDQFAPGAYQWNGSLCALLSSPQHVQLPDTVTVTLDGSGESVELSLPPD